MSRGTSIVRLAAALLVAIPGICRAGTLVIPPTTVLGTDVFSGPTFIVPNALTPGDTTNVQGVGTVDLASGDFTANAAGVIVAPATTNTGNHPGEVAINAVNGFPFAAVLIGNTSLGFFPLFPADAATGLGNSSPPTTIAVSETLADIFGPSFQGLAAGTVLELRVNDINTGDNSGSFLVGSVPEPSSVVLLGLGGLLLAGVAWPRRRVIG
jgi:hypothetical protein